MYVDQAFVYTLRHQTHAKQYATKVIQELITMNSFLGKYYYTQFYLLCHMGTQILPIHA